MLTRLVREGVLFRVGLEKEVKRVEDGHFGHEIDCNAHLARLLRKGEARQEIGLRVLLPVDEVLGGLDPQRISEDACPAVRRRSQAHDLRTQCDESIVAIVRDMIECDMDRHEEPPHPAMADIIRPF